MTNKSLITFCLSIILGFTMLSASVFYGFKAYTAGLETNNLRYEMVSNGENVFVLTEQQGHIGRNLLHLTKDRQIG